jgi:hypothetical protein
VSEADFTEAEYDRLVRLALKHYRFGSFIEWREAPPRTVLWRHDLDFSVHRAVALARIEADAGARATYFLNLHSAYYNALESEVADRVREIVALGHELGLHFDPSFETSRDQHEALSAEGSLLEDVFGVPVRSFSLHNPVVAGWSADDDEVVGMVNAYGRGLRERFAYCSDSHGVWRNRRLHDVLEEAADERLHVLTHPEWWVPEPLPARDRVTRAIEGRAARTQERYDRVSAEILARDRK